MQISDLAGWFSDPNNFGTLVSAATSIVALILGLIIGAMIVSSQAGKQTRTADEHAKASVVAEVLDATTELAVYASLPAAAQAASDRTVARVDVRLRVLPVQGAGSVADWTGHQLTELKRASAVGVTAAQTTLDTLRDRLVLWVYNPKRAAKQCQRDLERWSFVSAGAQASSGRRTPAQDFPDMGATNPFEPAPIGTAQPVAPAQMAPQAAPAVPNAPAPVPSGPAPVPAATSSIPAAAAAHAQAAAAQPKDPFEDLLGPGGARR